MKKILVAAMAMGMLMSAGHAGVSKLYVGDTYNGVKQWVIVRCRTGYLSKH